MSDFPWLDFFQQLQDGGMLGRRRSTPSELTEKALPDFETKTKINLPPDDFLSAPVTDLERSMLGQVPPGMLHQLNKQSLDREMNNMQFFHMLQRSKPKMM
jgi:hypothetical protein